MARTTNFASILATLTPIRSGIAPIQYSSPSTWNEQTFLGEPQPQGERLKRFMSNDGQYWQSINRYASNGKREVTLFDDENSDTLIGWAQFNPTVYFNFIFRYQADEFDVSTIRQQVMLGCAIENTPAREMSNDIAIIKFMVNYGQLKLLDANGNPLGYNG